VCVCVCVCVCEWACRPVNMLPWSLTGQIFVSIDERTTVAELATVLRIDLQLVKVCGYEPVCG
jgi:hypothetical protein